MTYSEGGEHDPYRDGILDRSQGSGPISAKVSTPSKRPAGPPRVDAPPPTGLIEIGGATGAFR
jgi:hypothetical protein